MQINQVQYTESIHHCLQNPQPGVDLILAAARHATGIPDLELTYEERNNYRQYARAASHSTANHKLFAPLRGGKSDL